MICQGRGLLKVCGGWMQEFFYLRNLQDEGKGRKVRAGAHGVVLVREGNPAAVDGPTHRLSFFFCVFVFPVHARHNSIVGYCLQVSPHGLGWKKCFCQ